MQQDVTIFLNQMIEAYHLERTVSDNPALICGKSYRINTHGVQGKCWFYQATPYAAMVYMDLEFHDAFSFPPNGKSCTYISYFSRLYGARGALNGKETPLRKNTIYTNLGRFEHTQTLFSSGGSLKGITIVFSPEHFEEQIFHYTGDQISLNEMNRFYSDESPLTDSIPLIIEQMEHCKLSGSIPLARVYFNSKITELLILFIDALRSSSPQNDRSSHAHTIQPVGAVKNDDRQMIEILEEYMRTHLDENSDLPTLANLAHMSTRKMTTVFKAVTGQTVQEYRTQLRLEAAAAMLDDPNYPIGEIADDLGFHGTSSFTTFFRKHMGESPRDYRNKKWDVSSS